MNRSVEQVLFAFLRLHDTVYQRSGGRIGQHVPGMPPSLLLHSTGAKSGQPRTSTLTYANDGNDYLIVASNGGSSRNPAWLHNLRAHPDVEINVGPRRFPVTAAILGPEDPDYPRLWNLVNKNNREMYRGYQTKTTRPISIIRLAPR